MSAVYSRVIRLSLDDMARSGLEGTARNARARARQRGDAENPNRDPGTYQGDDVLGARGELAAHVAFGVPWEPGPELDDAAGDVVDRHGQAWWIKATKYDSGHLPITLKDVRLHGLMPFMLVTGSGSWLTLRGWGIGEQLAQPRYARVLPRGGRGYWIPQGDLRPFDLIPGPVRLDPGAAVTSGPSPQVLDGACGRI